MSDAITRTAADIPRELLRDQLDVMKAYAEGRTPDVIFPSVLIDPYEERAHQAPLTYGHVQQAIESAGYFIATMARLAPTEADAFTAEYNSLLPQVYRRRDNEVRHIRRTGTGN